MRKNETPNTPITQYPNHPIPLYNTPLQYPSTIPLYMSGWWDDQSAIQLETRTQIVTQAFKKVAADLGRQIGNDSSAWQWKYVHFIEQCIRSESCH